MIQLSSAKGGRYQFPDADFLFDLDSSTDVGISGIVNYGRPSQSSVSKRETEPRSHLLRWAEKLAFSIPLKSRRGLSQSDRLPLSSRSFRQGNQVDLLRSLAN